MEEIPLETMIDAFTARELAGRSKEDLLRIFQGAGAARQKNVIECLDVAQLSNVEFAKLLQNARDEKVFDSLWALRRKKSGHGRGRRAAPSRDQR